MAQPAKTKTKQTKWHKRDFRLGKALGGGQRVLREPTNDFAWDSGLE